MARKGRIPAELRDNAVDDIKTQQGAEHSLVRDPAAPGVLFTRSALCGDRHRGDSISGVVHPAVACPVDADAVEDLACCAKCAVLDL